jgi:hypothetical protein
MYSRANSALAQLKYDITNAGLVIVLQPLAGTQWNFPAAPTDSTLGVPTYGKPFGVLTFVDVANQAAAKVEHILYSARAAGAGADAGCMVYTVVAGGRGWEGSTAQAWVAGALGMQQVTDDVLELKTPIAALRSGLALVHARDGLMSWDGANFKFTTFQVSTIGRGKHWSSAGVFTISMPANATTVKGVGGAADQAVAAGTIPIAAQLSLWFEPFVSGAAASIAGNFKLVGTAADFVVPAHWIFLAVHDAAIALDKVLRVGNGATLYPWIPFVFQGAWVDFGGGAATCAYYKGPDQIVRLKGSAKSGVIGTAIANLPGGFIPSGTSNFVVPSNGALGVLSVTTAGAIVTASGSNASFGLDGVTWRAEN